MNEISKEYTMESKQEQKTSKEYNWKKEIIEIQLSQKWRILYSTVTTKISIMDNNVFLYY